MPELPDIVSYVEALSEVVTGARLDHLLVRHPFFLRTVIPAPDRCAGRNVVTVHRSGKQIVVELEGGLYVAVHLMVAGRLAWRHVSRVAPGIGSPPKGRAGKAVLGEICFTSGTLSVTEAGTQRRAALRILEGTDARAALDRGGVELLSCTTAELAEALRRENHTLKRVLTDPRLVSGIGNAYSDEILHAAHLSPFARTPSLSSAEITALHETGRDLLVSWVERLRVERGGGFPRKVTAFHPAMAVHGKYGHPCPVCGTTVQRIRYAENEANYCPRCQTGGQVYADRALSRLLKDDWPRTVEELERMAASGWLP